MYSGIIGVNSISRPDTCLACIYVQSSFLLYVSVYIMWCKDKQSKKKRNCNSYASVVFTFPAVLQSLCTQTGPHQQHCCLLIVAICYSACLPAAAFYIVVSQNVVTVAFVHVLEMHVLVETSKTLICCLLSPPRHQHIMCFVCIMTCVRTHLRVKFTAWHSYNKHQTKQAVAGLYHTSYN